MNRHEIYLSGTSINNISMIIRLEDENIKKIILQNVNKILNNNDLFKDNDTFKNNV